MIVKKLVKKRLIFFLSLAVFTAVLFFTQVYQRTNAEQSGSSPDSGSNSRLKTASTAVTALGFGSDSAGAWGDWGAMWNRIYSSAIWAPGGSAAITDVASGKSFYAGSRGLLTGTLALTGNATASDVSLGKTFYSNSFTIQTGTMTSANLSNEKNGSGTGTADCATTFDIKCFTQAKGGVDDYNNNQTIPADTYKLTWTTCNSGNTNCGTGRSVAEKQDPNTGLVWSPRISSSSTWFVANNCVAPGGVGSLGATCSSNNAPGCVCVKNVSVKTGCENYDDGNWRLPYQKELMQSYIDGSWGNLTLPTNYYWSSTTESDYTYQAWYTLQYNGTTTVSSKTNDNSVRCVR